MSEYIKINNLGSGKSEEADNSDELVAKYNKQKDNGNLNKAHVLGNILAEMVVNNDGEFIFGYDDDNEEAKVVILHRRLLLAFTIDRGLILFTPNSIVCKTALSSFFKYIQENAPDIYNSL